MSLTSIRLLIIEDHPDDAELMIDQFESSGYTVHSKRVASAAELREVLSEPWELILSDHVMPSFSSRGALKIVKETGHDIPFILISGSIGEQEAVEMMRLGVSDYILKDNLDRLVVSAERELREAASRKKRREAERELKQSEMRLREMYAQADRLNRVKDEFLATLSHELRTPLNVIMGNAELLLENAEASQDEEIKSFVEAIYRNSVLQTQLVNDLLDISSIITGKIRFEPSDISPINVIQQIVETLIPTARAKGIKLKTDFKGQSVTVSADRNRLQQILWNLLSNALKFTNKHGTIQINTFHKEQFFIFEVIDDGIGIDPEFLPKIFENFHQEDSSISRRYGGLGLGLSIVRSLVELHGGMVQAESAGKERGSKFTVAIPYVRELPPETEASTHKAAPQDKGKSKVAEKSLKGMKILLVEDSIDTRLLVMLILTRAGAEVREAESAENARDVLKTFIPDVILSDIGMPQENGMEFIKKLRSHESESFRYIHAIALTAFAREEERAEILSSGFQNHITKPVSATTLLDAIQQLLPPPSVLSSRAFPRQSHISNGYE